MEENKKAPEISLNFVGMVMGVILGVTLREACTPLIKEFSSLDYRAILLFIGALIFVEMYIVLQRYHISLRVKYMPLLMFYDLIIGFLFVLFVRLVSESFESHSIQPAGFAMLICVFIFLLLAGRQLFLYIRLKKTDLDERLKGAELERRKLIIPIYFDIVAIFVCIAIFLAQRNNEFLLLNAMWWTWIAFILLVVYLVFAHVLKASLRDE